MTLIIIALTSLAIAPPIPLEDYQDRTDLSPSLEFIRLIVSDKEQTISRAKDLAEYSGPQNQDNRLRYTLS